MKKGYQPVPVAVAKDIAEGHDKSIVIILSWDPVHGLLHTTTYGVSPIDKQWAAEGGDIAAKALGADFDRLKTYEDFRNKNDKKTA